MGCVASKIGEEEEQVVIICRERKKQLKVAVEKRYALANAHCRYSQALYAVAASLKLFQKVSSRVEYFNYMQMQMPLPHNIDNNREFEQQQQQNGLAIGETRRDLMEALQDIQDHFIRAYDSGKDVSRMLEANRIHLQSSLDEIKENSTKIIQAITWHRSISSTKSSSCKSLVASSSKGCSTWTDFKNDLFDDYGGMDSGSHSLTLGRLYAWEKKLYEEVKAGDNLRKIYERKCARLKEQEVRGDNEMTRHKTRATVKDIYAQILVAIRSAESISMRIQKLRDEELQPQIVELLNGLRDTWKVMMETHETQNKILSEVKTFSCPSFGKFSNDSHRLATLQVEAELHNLRECFLEFVKVQKAYVQALHSWLTKFLVPEVEFYSKGRSSGAPYLAGGPKLLITCHEWLASMKKLPDKDVAFALKSFSKDVQALWTQQGEEQQQKRKVDSLTKELDRRTLAFQKNETRFLESKLIEYQSEENVENRNDHLTEKKDQLDALKRKLEAELEKHRDCVQETKRMTLNGFQTGFTPVFKSLAEFSKASWKMYNDLVSDSESTEKAENQSYIEDSQAGENSER
ncbi:hypothetical protein ACFE04_013136 [Oxalis oulophora]